MSATNGHDAIAALMLQMTGSFLHELPEKCYQIEALLLKLEDPTAHHAVIFDELYRKVHSLKGTGGTLGLPIVTSICHALENSLTAAHGNYAPPFADNSLRYVDLLLQVRDASERGNITSIQEALDSLATATGGELSVLVIEPSKTFAHSYRKVLQEHHARETHVTTGMKALEVLLLEKFDLIITARHLSDISAFGVLCGIRYSDNRNRTTSTVVLASDTSNIPACIPLDHVVKRDAFMLENIGKILRALQQKPSIAKS
ncbi:response regulator [Chrysiogenes arsenatis]|uniref:response regulator n=1 Tax=Chrysiogenes arsenatis TaxID=309797 RepID=UPI0003F89473|nr:response regulator [Chrysiogenes arsenatis]